LTGLHAETQKLQIENKKLLETSDTWKNLTAEQRQEFESRFALNDLPAADVSSESALIASLDAYDVDRWKMLIEAIPQRFANALQEGARLLAPKATTIRLPRATLRSEEEVDAWLKTTGAELKEKVKKGPLIIS